MKLKVKANEVREVMSRSVLKTKKKEVIRDKDLLSTGSTLLNLALSGRPRGGYLKGKYFFIVGDSKSGKTWLSMTCLAEAARNPEFDDYAFHYDNVEDGMLADVEKFFGKKAAARLEPPKLDKHGEPAFSSTIEDFYFNVDDLVKKGRPFIYVLDSMDGLTSKDEEKKFDEQKEASRNGKETTGSYGDGKAKKNSAGMRKLLRGIRKTKSILIVICQTRDNINGMFGETKTRSGGRALRFYATAEFWSALVGQITKTIRGKKRKIGNYTQIQFKKNRLTGKEDQITIAIYPSYGLDDVGSCIDFMVEEGFWSGGKKGEKINARDLGVKSTRDKLVRICEDRRDDLVEAVAKAWRTLAEESALQRRPRYE